MDHVLEFPVADVLNGIDALLQIALDSLDLLGCCREGVVSPLWLGSRLHVESFRNSRKQLGKGTYI